MRQHDACARLKLPPGDEVSGWRPDAYNVESMTQRNLSWQKKSLWYEHRKCEEESTGDPPEHNRSQQNGVMQHQNVGPGNHRQCGPYVQAEVSCDHANVGV